MLRKLIPAIFLLLLLLAALSITRTPQGPAEQAPQEVGEPSDEPLTLTAKAGSTTLTLEVSAPDAEGFTPYVLRADDGTEIAADRVSLGGQDAAACFALTAQDDVLGFPGAVVEVLSDTSMTVRTYYAQTEQGFVRVGEVFGFDFGTADSDGAWPLDLDGDGRSELVTRSTYGDGVPCISVYRWDADSAAVQQSDLDWEKADAQLAQQSAPLGATARAETCHAADHTVTLTLLVDGEPLTSTVPLTTDILGEWRAAE